MAVTDMPTGNEKPKVKLLNDPKFRSIAFQIILVIFLAWVVWSMIGNAAYNLEKAGIASGFGFLSTSSGFGLNFSPFLEYTSSSSFLQVYWVGLQNTLVLAVIGIFFATIIGFIMGVARLSNNWVISKIAYWYVEIMRNIPLLLQIFIWYKGVLATLPLAKNSIDLGAFGFLNTKGLFAPQFIFSEGSDLMGWALLVPRGGMRVIPEFIALILALSLYTAAFIAEIVRAGILAVNRGQTEASYALGLRPGQTLRLNIIPQALRVIIPPLTSQYLNLTKNSSLAVAIAYPDLTAVFAGTALNQTGQAVEIVGMTMLTYLAISLVTSLFMNWYNAKNSLVER